MNKIAIVESGNNLFRALEWLKQEEQQVGIDFAWYREIRTPDAPLLRFTFIREKVAMMFALRWMK